MRRVGPPRRRVPLGAALLAAIAVAAMVVGSPGVASETSSQRSVPVEVASAAVPLSSTEPGSADAPSPDLQALAGWVGASRVVGLGEGAHGTHTLHRLTHRIFAHLAGAAGFDVLALEHGSCLGHGRTRQGRETRHDERIGEVHADRQAVVDDQDARAHAGPPLLPRPSTPSTAPISPSGKMRSAAPSSAASRGMP